MNKKLISAIDKKRKAIKAPRASSSHILLSCILDIIEMGNIPQGRDIILCSSYLKAEHNHADLPILEWARKYSTLAQKAKIASLKNSLDMSGQSC